MIQALKTVMVVSYVLGLVVMVIAAYIKVATVAGSGPGYEAGNWAVGACALFLCALASTRMMEIGKK